MIEMNLLRFFITLLLVSGGILGIVYLLRMFKLGIVPGPKAGVHLHLLEVLPLDTQRRLLLISCDQEPVLILASPKGDHIIPAPISRTTKSGPFPTKSYGIIGFFLLALFMTVFSGTPAAAAGLSLDLGEGGTFPARMIQLITLLTVFSLAPSLLVMVTSFTRIVVVLSFLRSALGLQNSPPNSIMISLALFLSFFIMSPALETAYQEGIRPYIEETISETQAWEKTSAPFHKFMREHAREKDLGLFMNLANIPSVSTPEDTPWRVLVPAFMISELRCAFEIGFLLFIPFLIIDLVVASVLMSMGMMMLPPITLSLPFKVIFFVLVDGWFILAGSLVRSYGGV